MKNNKGYIESKIEQYIKVNKLKYCFDLNGYLIPDKLVTNNRKRVSLKANRNKQLKIGNSPYSKNMEKYLIDQNINYIKEFIIIIQNTSLWESILSFCKLSEEDKKKYEEMNYFSLDYFIPESLSCIEVDSDYHKNREILDYARDLYLKSEFKIETFRLYHFGSDYIKDSEGIAALKNRMSQVYCEDPKSLFDYTEILISNFKYENEYFLIMLGKLVNVIGFEKMITSNIKLTEKDYNDLSQGINFGNLTYPMMFCNDFINFAKDLFNYNITVLNGIVSYSIFDIGHILNNRNLPIQSDIISKFGFIPYWSARFMRIPKEYINFISQVTDEDKLILKYIQDGKIKLKTYV